MRALIAAILASAVASGANAAPAPAQPVVGSYEVSPIGAPTGTGKVQIQVTIVVKGKPVTKTVTIPKGDIKPYSLTGACTGINNAKDCAQAIADRMADASQAKAKVYADAINAAFKNEFMALGEMASVGNKVVTKTIKTSYGNVPDVSATYGALVIPGVSMNQNPIKWIENGVTGEGGNAGRFIPPPGKSPGGRGSLERTTPGMETVSTGTDAQGNPSEVDFGLVGTYVAEVDPYEGETDAQVLMQLAMDLNDHDVAATYDSSDVSLTVNVPDNTFLDWGYTDTGLDFTMSMEGLAPPIPAPPGWALLAVGLGVLGLYRGRRSAR